MGEWVASKTDGAYFKEKSAAIGLERNGRLEAGVIYENWNGVSIVCHIAFIGRLTPEFLAAVFHYPFSQCGVSKLIGPVCGWNPRAHTLVQHLGFREECRIADACPSGDIIFYTMARDACRFLEGRYGEKRQAATDA